MHSVVILCDWATEMRSATFPQKRNTHSSQILHLINSVRSLSHVPLFMTLSQCTRLPSPSPTPGAYSNSCPLSHWGHSNNFILSLSPSPPSVFPSITVFSNKSVLCIRWPKYWSFSFNINPSNEYSELISFRVNWLELLPVQGTLKSLLQQHRSKA